MSLHRAMELIPHRNGGTEKDSHNYTVNNTMFVLYNYITWKERRIDSPEYTYTSGPVCMFYFIGHMLRANRFF